MLDSEMVTTSAHNAQINRQIDSEMPNNNSNLVTSDVTGINTGNQLDIPEFRLIESGSIQKFGKIGGGGFGEVFAGEYLGSEVAIKQLKPNLSQEAVDELEKEAAIMSRLKSPALVQFFGVARLDGVYTLIMELMKGGTLFDHLQNNEITWNQRIDFAKDIARGLIYLHHHNIIHRDLKSLNVLLDQHNKAKITDFGLSKAKEETNLGDMTNSTEMMTSSGSGAGIGTKRWMAPECFKRRATRGFFTDMWAYGMVLWEITTARVPFADEPDNAMVASWIVQGEKEEIPDDCHPIFKRIIESCWIDDGKQRPTAQDVLNILNGREPTSKNNLSTINQNDENIKNEKASTNENIKTKNIEKEKQRAIEDKNIMEIENKKLIAKEEKLQKEIEEKKNASKIQKEKGPTERKQQSGSRDSKMRIAKEDKKNGRMEKASKNVSQNEPDSIDIAPRSMTESKEEV